jgi:hypothetical protein
MPEPEVFLPLPFSRDRATVVSQVRSTLITSSVRALQTRGAFERYLTLLPKELHATITEVVAGVWVPYALAEAHYTACNQLGYGTHEFAEIGKDVGNRINGTMLSTAVRMAKGAGATPWTIFAQYGRLWDRIFVGGGLMVRRIGPKEAHVEVVGQPLVKIPYFRSAQRAVCLGVIELFCRKAYAFDVPRSTTPTGTTYRFAWV